MSESKIPRMRTIAQCAAYIKEMDKDTRITEYRIRMMVAGNEIPYTMCGRTKLVNLDKLLEHLEAGSKVPEQETKTNRPKIRKLVG